LEHKKAEREKSRIGFQRKRNKGSEKLATTIVALLERKH